MRLLTARRLAALIGGGAIALIIVALVATCVGSTGAFGWPDGAVLAWRRDRVLLAGLVGAGLGVAGACYQAVLRNDLADPYLLGIASGAALAGYAWRLPWTAAVVAALGPTLGAFGHEAATFAGAIAAAAFVLAVAGARGRFDPATLVLVGVTVSSMCGAVILLLFYLAKSLPGSGSVQSVFVGELRSSLTRAEFWTAATIVIVGGVALTLRADQLNVAMLSDDEARGLGLRASRERAIQLAAASLVTAASVAVAGPVGFVGLIAPHVARRFVGTDNRVVLPLSAIGGAMLVVFADALLRALAGVAQVNTIIPLGVATSLLGGPFFLTLLARRDRGTS